MDNVPPGDFVETATALNPKPTGQTLSVMLTQLAQSADRALYVQLFKHFAPKIKAYIIRMGLTSSTADELTQETMLAVWQKCHLYNPAKAAASTWIYTLARNQSIDWMRKQKYPEYSIEHWQEDECGVDNAGEQTVLSDAVGAAIATLPENQAQVIYMSFFEGRSHSEIAARLGIPLGSVKSRLRLAAEKLKTRWSDVP